MQNLSACAKTDTTSCKTDTTSCETDTALCKTETGAALFEGQHEPCARHLFACVLRQVELVEACVSTWQQVGAAIGPAAAHCVSTLHTSRIHVCTHKSESSCML